ncbi:hypothetical protein EPO15_18560 [bacterium]|nr:MAG: hypothetical protein EPO15_18560 [bacterium]
MAQLHDYLLDLRLVSVNAAALSILLAKAALPVWPGWWVSRKIYKGGANRLPTVLAGGAVSAGLATLVISFGQAVAGMNDPAPDAGIWPLGVLITLGLGLFFFWPAYALAVHLVLRRRPPALPPSG